MAKPTRWLVILLVACLVAFLVTKVIGHWQDSQNRTIQWRGYDSGYQSQTTSPASKSGANP